MTAAAEPVLADRAPKPGVRLTASTITDDQLDALYAERDQLAAVIARVRDLREQARTEEPRAQGPTWAGLAQALDGPSEPRTAPTTALVPPVGLRDAQSPTGGPR